jgi:hypothetical protein
LWAMVMRHMVRAHRWWKWRRRLRRSSRKHQISLP